MRSYSGVIMFSQDESLGRLRIASCRAVEARIERRKRDRSNLTVIE